MRQYGTSFVRVNPDPRFPVSLTPGSPEKIELLRRRATLALPLFLKGDTVGPRQWGRADEMALVACFTSEERAAIRSVAPDDNSIRKLADRLGHEIYLVRMARNILRGRKVA